MSIRLVNRIMDLRDINITNVQDSQILEYNTTSEKWVNTDYTPGEGGTDPNDISNTVVLNTTGLVTILSIPVPNNESEVGVLTVKGVKSDNNNTVQHKYQVAYDNSTGTPDVQALLISELSSNDVFTDYALSIEAVAGYIHFKAQAINGVVYTVTSNWDQM